MVKLFHWSTKSSNTAWVMSGYDLLNTDDIQRSAHRIMTEIAARKGIQLASDITFFLLDTPLRNV